MEEDIVKEREDSLEVASKEIVDDALSSYRQQDFLQTNINLDNEKADDYRELRNQYGEKPSKSQVSVFYDTLGSLNCSLIADWHVAHIEEREKNIKATKIFIAEERYPGDNNFSHAIVRIERGDEAVFYEPSSGYIFKNLLEVDAYFNKIFPQPDGRKFLFSEAY
jgi:hypothetical protein